MPPRFLHTMRLNLVLSKAQNCYARTGSGKLAVSEISLAVHARVTKPEEHKSLLDPLNLLQV